MSARHLFHSGAGHQSPELPTAGCVSLARGLRPASLLALHAQSRPGLYQPVAVQRLPCRPVLEFQWVKSRASCDAGTWSSGEGARPPSTSLPVVPCRNLYPNTGSVVQKDCLECPNDFVLTAPTYETG